MAMARAALDVDRSMLGRRWRARLDEAGEMQALAIGQAHGLPDLLARIAAGRGQTVATCPGYLDPSLRDAMPDPATLLDMAAATDRLARAVAKGERVAIFGDYDVDGACAAALLADYLTAAGLAPVIHIPDRITEGYGPNVAAIEALRREGASLLVTVDCGTTSLDPLARARAIGLDVLVVDHHQAPAALPAVAALVNPNRLDDLSGLGHLCAAGVVFMLLVALHRHLREAGFWGAPRRAPDLLAGLDLVALATVADVVPLKGLNRAFVAKGLAVMRLRGRPGLAALFDVAGADGPPTAFHCGFLVGPRINAGGRIDDAALGARLLMTRDPLLARSLAETLDGLNRDRRAIEAAALVEAEEAALSLLYGPGGEDPVLVASGVGWHPGVVGLVAARLRERYERPAFAVAINGETGTGSGRSIPGVDLGRVVREAVEAGLLLKGGGHAMAAGITIEAARLDAFRVFLRERCALAVDTSRATAGLDIDATLGAAAIDTAVVTLADRAGPFGSGNPEPLFAVPHHRLVSLMPVGADHLRLSLAAGDGTRLSAIAFRAAGSALGTQLKAAEGRSIHVAGHLSLNRRGGGARPDLRVVDAALAHRTPD